MKRGKWKYGKLFAIFVSAFLLLALAGVHVFATDTGASVTASYTFFMDSTGHVNDGVISYNNSPTNRWTAYESPNAQDWVQTSFGSAVTRNKADIHIYDDGGGVRAPASYDVQYWNGSAWTSVAGAVKSPAAPAGNALNSVSFNSVTASNFRVVFTHAAGAKSGVSEIAYGYGSSPTPTPSALPTPSASPTPPSALPSGAASASYTFFMDNINHINDGIISYTNSPTNRWTAYESPNGTDWTQTDFGSAYSVSEAHIYLYSDGGGVKAPASYDVQYWNGSGWTSAANQVKSPAAPTGNALNTVSFNSVSSSKVRVVFTHASGSKSGATEIAYFGGGTTPTPTATPTASPTPTPTATPSASPTPTPSPGAYPQYQVSVISPAYGSTVNGNVTIQFYAPGMKNVWARAWHQPDTANPGSNGYDRWFQQVAPDASGYGEVTFPADQFPHGPTTIILSAWDSPEGNPNFTYSDNCYLQLFNSGGVVWNRGVPSAPPQAAGMSVLYQDDFTGGLSVSRTGAGATYASSKPDGPNGTEFGDAIFADYNGPYNPFSILGDHYLRIRVSETPDGYVDPMGWNRTFFGGLLSSLRTDGTGIAATYGYFEARMMMPPGNGAWPAFWLMSQDSIADGVPSTAEIDIVESYGHSAESACQAYHWWGLDPELHVTYCGSNKFTFGDNASTWHIYGVKITPTDIIYYIDNVEVWRHATFEQAKTPMYFMINLALGGGWPVDLARYNNQIDLFVDYIRVFE